MDTLKAFHFINFAVLYIFMVHVSGVYSMDHYFFVENYFVFLSYLLGGSSGQTVVFYKLDKYLKLFYSFLVGFYQRTLFYIQMQNELSISSKNLMVGFICVSCFSVIPLYFFLSSWLCFPFKLWDLAVFIMFLSST